MFKLIHKISLIIIFFYLTFTSILRAEVIEKIDIQGNKRISSETIRMFAAVSAGDDLSENSINEILKKLYNTNFFDLVSVKISNNTLVIKVTDQGKGFDKSKVEIPNIEKKLASDYKRGWGLQLIQELMDTVEFESTVEGTTVTMTKKR